MKETAYLSLGSNLGDRENNLRQAIASLREVGNVRAVSSFYETEPVEVEDEQPWFLNCAVRLEISMGPDELLAAILAIEREMGRRRDAVRAPRTIDIDILLFGDLVVDLPHLTIPHPGLSHRRFVLEPLAEIAPNVRHPVSQLTVCELLRTLATVPGQVRRQAGQ
ncbi:MAG TPA: 2-amino-4-hydroxy-6-hydroxymethyldihydropteridine diphosphokinase [Candidatus Angelobacter sp.]